MPQKDDQLGLLKMIRSFHSSLFKLIFNVRHRGNLSEDIAKSQSYLLVVLVKCNKT